MCGRITNGVTWEEMHRRYGLINSHAPNLRPSWNVAPTQNLGAIVFENDEDDGLVYARMRWGLIPRWWKKPLKDLPSTFNARGETVAEKPMFRSAFKLRRCLIPVSGFYEWKGKRGAKEPHYISMADGGIHGWKGYWTPVCGGQVAFATMSAMPVEIPSIDLK